MIQTLTYNGSDNTYSEINDLQPNIVRLQWPFSYPLQGHMVVYAATSMIASSPNLR